MKFAQFISIFSLAVLYDQAMQRLARTDMLAFEKFIEGAERHWQKFIEWYQLRYTDLNAFREVKLPEFSYSTEINTKSLVATLPQVMILFLFSVIFFVLAYVSFLRKDVR